MRQHRPWINPATVWAALLALTLAAWIDSTVSPASTVTAAVVIALTLIKVLLVVASSRVVYESDLISGTGVS